VDNRNAANLVSGEILSVMELDFSVMEGDGKQAEQLLPLMEAFEKQYHIHVNIIPIPWEKAWSEIAKYGIYGHGPDVSTIGASWIGSLASMQALRPFTPAQIQALGGANAYFESIWQAGLLRDGPTIWAIPWLGDVRVIYYWKDTLKKAGVKDFDAAFKTDIALVKTLEKLKKEGVKYPLAITTLPMSLAVHEAAHWVWNAGGDFVSPDGKRVIFTEPKGLEGFKNYFSLLRYINPQSMKNASGVFFYEESSPVHIAGLWVPSSKNITAERKDQLGVARLPGMAYVGGSALVIWQYTSRFTEAFELIRFLSSEPLIYNKKDLQYKQLPTRRESLDAPETQNNVFNRIYMQTLQSGKTFPTLRLWGLIEEKLLVGIANIWADLFDNPDQDLDACLHKHLDPLAKRLNMILGN
jgi:multiple sugar transport system substrate-binding protein